MDECLNLSRKVFKIDQVLLGKIPVGDNQCRFDYNILEITIKAIINDRLKPEDCSMLSVSNLHYRVFPTFVIAKKAANADGPPTVFRSYSGDDIRSSRCAIWQAARATSAAPSFFKEMHIDKSTLPSPGITFIDGGLGYNNPSRVALDEAEQLWPTSKHFCLISIGTGRQRAVKLVSTSNSDDNIDTQRSLFQQVMSFVPDIVLYVPGWKTTTNFPRGILALIKMASAIPWD